MCKPGCHYLHITAAGLDAGCASAEAVGLTALITSGRSAKAQRNYPDEMEANEDGYACGFVKIDGGFGPVGSCGISLWKLIIGIRWNSLKQTIGIASV